MPKAFTDCVKNGGKVITKVIDKKKGKYMHICYDKNGKANPGEVLTKKKKASLDESRALLKELQTLKGYWNDRSKDKKKRSS